MSVYLAIVSGAIKLLNYITASLQQHHDELNGANAQKVADQIVQKQVLDALTAPVSKSESDSLWDENKSRFGTGIGSS